MNHDVYVLLPGITGSVLQKDGKDVFGLSAAAGFEALFSGGESIQGLKLTEDPWEEQDLGDGITAPRLVADAHMVPGLWKIDGYTKVGEFLRRRFSLVPQESYFEFPYDWRRDNRVAARRLAAESKQWLAARRKTDPDAKLVLVGHSMGGLVSRYFLEVLDGWRDTRALITFGTPYRGSVNAVDFVANGFRKFFGLVDLSDMMCSFTSVRQLLPIYPCIDVGNKELARLSEAPYVLPRLAPEAIGAARQFHAEIEEAVARNRHDAEYLEHGYRVGAVIGVEQPTNQSAIWRDGTLEIVRTYNSEDMGGDGTVPRVAASPQEWEKDTGAMFSSDKHASLQNADAVLTQAHGWMTGQDLGDFRALVPSIVSVELADVYELGQPVIVGLRPSSATTNLEVSLTWVDGPEAPVQPISRVVLPVVEGAQDVEIVAVAPGCYRVHVSSDDVEPVTDLVLVAPT